jgi:hypothetical protein
MAHQSVPGRLETDGGERAAEVRLAAADQPQAGRAGILGEPEQVEFVGHGEAHDGVGAVMPVGEDPRMGDGEVAGGVDRLAGLGSRR